MPNFDWSKERNNSVSPLSLAATEESNIRFGRARRESAGLFSPTELGKGIVSGTLDIASGITKTAEAVTGAELSGDERIDRFRATHGNLAPPKNYSPMYDLGTQVPLLTSLVVGGGVAGGTASFLRASARGISVASRLGQGAAMFNVVFGDKYERVRNVNPNLSHTDAVGAAFLNSMAEASIELIGGPNVVIADTMAQRLIQRTAKNQGLMALSRRIATASGKNSYRILKQTFNEAFVEEFSQAMSDEITDLLVSGGNDPIEVRKGIDQAVHALFPAFVLSAGSIGYHNMQIQRSVRRYEQVNKAMEDASTRVDGQYLGGSFEAAQKMINEGFDQLEQEYAKHMDPQTASSLRTVLQISATNMAAQRADATPLSYIQDFKQLFVDKDLSPDEIQQIVEASNKGGDAFHETMGRIVPEYRELTHGYIQDAELRSLTEQNNSRLSQLEREYGQAIDIDAEVRELLDEQTLEEEGADNVEQAMENDLLMERAKAVVINRRLAEVQAREASSPARITSDEDARRIESMVSVAATRINEERNGGNAADRTDLARGLLAARIAAQDAYGGDSSVADLKQDIESMSREEIINELHELSIDLHLETASPAVRTFIETDTAEYVPTLEERFDEYQLPTVLERDLNNNITPESAARAAVAMEDEFNILLWPQNLNQEQQRIASVYNALMDLADQETYSRSYYDEETRVYETAESQERYGLPAPTNVQNARTTLSSQLGSKTLDIFKVSKIGEAQDAVGGLYAKIEKLYKDTDPFARRNRAALRIAVEILEADAYERVTTTQIMEAERKIEKREAAQRAERAELLETGEFNSLEDINVDSTGAAEVDELINKERARIRKLEAQRMKERARKQAALEVAVKLRGLPPTESEIFDAQEQTQIIQDKILVEMQAEAERKKLDELRRIELELEREANQQVKRTTLESSSQIELYNDLPSPEELPPPADGFVRVYHGIKDVADIPSMLREGITTRNNRSIEDERFVSGWTDPNDTSFGSVRIAFDVPASEAVVSGKQVAVDRNISPDEIVGVVMQKPSNGNEIFSDIEARRRQRAPISEENLKKILSYAPSGWILKDGYYFPPQKTNTLESSNGFGPSFAAYLIRTERAFSRDNASRRAMEIIERLQAGEYEQVVKEYDDMPMSVRAMVDTFSPRAEVKKQAQDQLTLFSARKARQTYALYEPEQKLAVYFNTATAEDVLHEWMHHIIDNDLLPIELRDSLIRHYAPEGTENINALSPQDWMNFHEDSVRAFFAWMKGTKEAPSDIRPAFDHIKAIMSEEAHALPDRMADVFVSEVFGVKTTTEDGNPSENSIMDEKTLAALFDEIAQNVDQDTVKRSAVLLRQSTEAEARDFPRSAMLRSRAIETSTPEELHKTIYGLLGGDRSQVRAITEQVTGRRYEGDAHPYKELLDESKAGSESAVKQLREIARRAAENADDTKVPPNWYHMLDNQARKRFGKDFKDVDEVHQRTLIAEAYRVTEAYKRERSAEKRYANLNDDPVILEDVSNLKLQISDDPRGKDLNAYDNGTVRNVISALDRKASGIGSWLTINTFDFYTFLDAMDGHVMEGEFNVAFGTRVKQGQDNAYKQYMEDADFLRKMQEKLGEFGNLTKRHTLGKNKRMLDGKQVIGIYSIYKMGPKAVAELESHEDLGATVEDRRSVIKDAVKLVENDGGLKNFATYMQEYFKYIWPKLDATHRSIHRDSDGNEKGIGRFDDWYFPFIRENGFFERRDKSATLNIMDVANRPGEKRIDVEGRYKERKWGQGKLNLDALVVFGEYQRQAQNYIGKARLVFEMSAMAEAIREDMNTRDRTGKYHHALRTFIEREQYPTGRMNPLTDAERVVRTGRGNVLPAMLMGRLVSVLRQPVSLSNAATQLPGKWIGRMTANFGELLKTGFKPTHAIDSLTGAHNPFVGHPMYERMVEHSPGILHRSFDPDVQDIATQTYKNGLMGRLRIQSGKLKGRTVAEVMMHPFRHMDLTTVISVWNAAFDFQRENLAGLGLSEESLNKKAAFYADKTVERTQPASNTAGRNMIQTGSEGIKALFPFTGQIFKNFQFINQHVVGTAKRAYQRGGMSEMFNTLLHGEYETVENSSGDKVQIRKAQPLLQKGFFTFIVPAIALGALARKREPESWNEIFDDLVAWNLSSIPLIGGVMASSFYYKIEGDAGVIYLDWLNSVGNVIADARNDEWSKYTTKDTLRAGNILGVPTVASDLATEVGYALRGEEPDWLRAIGLGVTERDGE